MTRHTKPGRTVGRRLATIVVWTVAVALAAAAFAADVVTYENPLPVQIRDPFILPYNGVYYLYGTNDADNGFKAFASQNLVDWIGPMTVYRKPDDATWNKYDFWAPEVVMRDGRFYLFYTAHGDEAHLGVGVAVGDSPLGPFVDAVDKPITPKGWDTLDPHVYVDDDGNGYLLFTHSWTQVGAGSLYAQPLADDFLSTQGEPVRLLSAADVPWSGGYLARVLEAPTLVVHDGRYYLMFSTFVYDAYAVGYAVAPSLWGPYEVKDRLLFDDSGHNGVVTGPDGLDYTVYHAPNADAPYWLHLDRYQFTPDGALVVEQTEGETQTIKLLTKP